MNDLNNQKLFGAINLLRKNSPHVFSILEHCQIEEADIPTAGVYWDKTTKKFKILIGHEFFNTLDDQNLSAVLEHELMHVLFEHLTFDLKGKNKNIMNIAMDSIINDCINIFKEEKAHEILDNRVKLKDINKGKFSIDKNTSLDVYDYLMKEKEENKSNGNGEGQEDQGPQTLDDHSQFGNEEISPIDQDIIKEALKNTIKNNTDKFQGIRSADLDRIIKEAIKSNYDFKKIFQYAVAKSLKADKNNTWKKTNRRFGNETKGHKKKPKPKVLMLVDTSGSINDEILAMVDYQINYLSKHYSFTVCYGDTDLKGVQEVKQGQKIKIKYKGGGGTDLNFYKKVKNYRDFDLIVFNTDGYIEAMDKDCKLKKIFCIFPYGKHVEGFKNIDITRAE